MLAMLQGDTWREPQCWRFTVRCDRATNAAIERAARAEGISVSAFVQAHFDRILDAPAVKAAEPAFDALSFARRHALAPSAAALWGLMKAGCNGEGLFSASYSSLGRAMGMTPNAIQHQVSRLIAAGLVTIVQAGWHSHPNIFQVVEPE